MPEIIIYNIKNVLEETKNNKSPGKDNITIEGCEKSPAKFNRFI